MSAANTPMTPATTRATTNTSPNILSTSLRVFTLIVLVLAVTTNAIYFVNALRWRNNTFPGFLTSYTLVVDGNKSFGATDWAGLDAGIQRLDRIQAVNDVRLSTEYGAARAEMREAFNQHNYADDNEVTVEFLRPEAQLNDTHDYCEAAVDGFATCTVTYPLKPMPESDFLTYFIFPFLTSIVALSVGVSVALLRPHNGNAQLIALFCVSLATFSAGTFNNSTSYFFMPLWLGFTMLGGISAYNIAITFPSRPTITYRQPALLGIIPVLGLGALIYDLQLFYQIPSPYQFTMVWQIPVGIAVSSFMVLLVTFLFRRQFVTSSIHRDQINTSLIGLGLATIPVLLWLTSNLGPPLPFNSATIMPFFISIPISMAYAVLQYRAFNTDRVLTQGITYTIMLYALVLGYFLLVTGINLIVNEYVHSDNPVLIATVIFIISVAFLPFRTWLQHQVDSIYYRERRQYQTQIELFTQEVSSSSMTKVIKLYIEQITSTLKTQTLFIFLPDGENKVYRATSLSHPETDVVFEQDSEFIRYLQKTRTMVRLDNNRWENALVTEKTRFQILNAYLIVPLLASRSEINGFVIIGPPGKNRSQYQYEEIRFLESLSTQMAISVERSQVVESLEVRVRELDVLSNVSQAVNFAVEFEDLLELISNQTLKLIEATHFYIVLLNSTSNQLYYAFFSEYNERLRKMENRRWNRGNDIFSYILSDGQPVRYDDYTIMVEQLGFNPRNISEDVKAWMGVRLIANEQPLGIMAVGTTRTNFTYSDERLKIFSDISALAATSIDKARLFDQTNQRARQLRALNDIGRRLQSERAVEPLIELITSSAVEILESDAGSLLLKADDESGAFVFSVVIGGAGQDIIGKRIEAGHGIVGRVAKTGKPELRNDIAEDDEWTGGVAESDTFTTQTLIAVPLIANNKVIGVLEVLNRKDGGFYVQEDVDLLETFASQAAIAIENARLFQSTDEQLQARVQELEALERIDTELNRKLDMNVIANITVRWAIANTGANAAILGLVSEDQHNMLEVLHITNYTEDEYPEGATKDFWPLDKGIVSRVMRTKRADTASDLAIDPDYVPSLKYATSQMTIPMIAGGKIVAMLILEKNTEPRLSLAEQNSVQRLADHAVIAIENARLYSQLEITNKSQSRYMGVGAHELKNALAPIKGWTDFMMSGMLGEVNERQTNSLSVIKANVSRAELIIQDLRDFAKMRANELRVNVEPIHFRNVVIETLRPFTQQIEEKEQTLINNVTEDLPHVLGDSQRLIQVMTNFVSNASKYSDNGATITIDAVVENDHRDRKTGKVLGDYLVVSISDTGMGISEEDQKQMFQPYFRSNNPEALEKHGTGLGMSLTKELINQHKGDVWLTSVLGEGSSFFFSLPIAKEDEPTDTETQDPVAE